jgi:hypothetical protein
VAAACLAMALLGTGGGFLLLPSGGDGPQAARGQEAAPKGAGAKETRDPEPPPKIPLDAKALLEALRHADTVFVGRVEKADLTAGAWSGWMMVTRAVTYEVKTTLKGGAKKVQTVEYLILRPGEYVEADNPRLNRRLFARGTEHLVCSRSDGKRQVVLFMTSAVQEAIPWIEQAGKPRGGS